MKFQHKLLLIALLGTLLAVFWQELNAHNLHISGEPRYGMVETADDASYLSPAENYIKNGVWTDNSSGVSRYFQRPPGYGILYGVFYLTLGKYALIGLKLVQIIVFYFSIFLFGKILFHLSNKERYTLIGALIFALLPIYSGFMYYTLTEAVSPFLLLWSIHTFLTSKSWVKVTIPFSLLLLVRPQLLIFSFILLMLSLIQKEKRKVFAITLSFLPFCLWMLRTILISGEFKGLHPIYSDTNHSLYRPGHEAMTNLFRVWESDGEVFHGTIACISESNNEQDLEQCSQNIPEEFRNDVRPMIKEYQLLLHRPDYGKSAKFKSDEERFVKSVQLARTKIIAKNPFIHYIGTPFKSAFYLLSKSQLNLSIFQAKFRGNIVMEFFRFFSLLLINLGIISSLVLLFKRRSALITSLSLSFLIYLFYLSFFQRLNEERYLTPLLPLLLIFLVLAFQEFMNLRAMKTQIEKG